MPVAKSYENFEIVREPFRRDGRMYVTIKNLCPRCGGSGQFAFNGLDSVCYDCKGSGFKVIDVRWYSEKERAAMDRAAEARNQIRVQKAPRNWFGFGDAGYITIFKGDRDRINTYFHDEVRGVARYCTHWGWYVPSAIEPPPLPNDIIPVHLMYDDVAQNDEIISQDRLNDLLETLLYDTKNVSKYQGEVDERIERVLTITSKRDFVGPYGASKVYTFTDENKNVYVWFTSGAKEYDEGITTKMRGTVKEHKTYHGIKQTILTRCMEVKK